MANWFVTLQNLLPQHPLSRAVGRLGTSTTPWIKDTFIRQFARAYDVNMAEAEESDLGAYASFNDFFTRQLKPGSRVVAAAPTEIACPADGHISQIGDLEGDQLLQAKGHRYSLTSLAGVLSDGLSGGSFVTVYLAPRDYHRVHMPISGTLTDSLAIPGALFSVNGTTEANIPGLFCRNERLVCRFDTEHGPVLVILVGALIVASIATDWGAPESPYRTTAHDRHDMAFTKGAELGRFLLGSTVICCFPPGYARLDTGLTPGAAVRMGQAIGTLESG